MANQGKVSIPYQDKEIAGIYSKPEASNGYGLILTHGAGGDMNTPQLTALANYMSERGFLVLRFTCKGLNIGYRTKVYHQVLTYFRDENQDMEGCFLAGKSMGSRAAVAVANLIKDTDLAGYVQGVVCLSYPLYPPGQLDKMRDEPLKDLQYPTLFLSGTKDDMAECSLLEKAVGNIPKEAKIYWIEGANHGHKVSGRKSEEVNDEIFLQMAEWCNYVMGVKAKKSGEHQGLSMSMMRDRLKMENIPNTPVGSREAQATSTDYTHTDRGKDGSQKGSLPSPARPRAENSTAKDSTTTSEEMNHAGKIASKRTAADDEEEEKSAKKPKSGRGRKKK